MAFGKTSDLIYTAGIGALLFATALPALPQTTAEGNEDAKRLNTIVVTTARKKAEDVQSVPIAITALSGDALEALGAEDLSDVANYAPNVSFDGTAAVSGSSIASTIFIRGVGQTDFTLNSDPGVGVYIDGVYVARSVGGLLDLVDVASVEVLRGPQGTLFGKNTNGGAINVTTRRPTGERRGYIEFQGGNFGRANAKAGFDFALSDTLAANVSAAFLNQEGYQERILEPDSPNLGDINRYVVRARALWTPSSQFEADLSVDYSRGREQSVPQTVVAFETSTGAPFLAAAGGAIPGTTPQIRPQYADRGFTGSDFLTGFFNNGDPRRSFYGGPSRSDFDIFGIAGTLTYDFGGVELKSITAYREVLSDFARDSLSSPFLAADTVDSYDQQQFSQELQLLGDIGERTDYVLGLYYLQEEGTNSNLVATSIGGLGSGGSVDNESVAAFGQVNIGLTDKLGLTLGARLTDETKRFDPGFRGGEQAFTVNANGSALGLGPVGSTIPLIVPPESLGLGNSYENADDNFDYTANLNYQATDDVMFYASYATGFKAGGFSQRIGPGPGVPAPDFRKEDVKTLEAGFKSTLAQQTLRLNGAVFFSDYTDLQVTPIFEGIGPVTRNIGDAEIWGAELEWTFAPNSAFEWTGGLGYLSNEIKSLTSEAAVNVALDGSQILTLDTQLPKTPDWSANSAVSYTVDLRDGKALTFRGNWSYTSEMFNDILNSNAIARDSVSLFGSSVTYSHDDWSVSLTGKNLTDEEYIIAGNDETALGQFGYAQATFARPREWWVTLKTSF